MIHFKELTNAQTLCSEHNITKIIIPLASDTMADCDLYRAISQRYPDLDEKFIKAVGHKTLKAGEYLRVQTESGHVIYFIITRVIEKFQAYYYDIIKALKRVLDHIRNETPQVDVGVRCSVMFPVPTGDELKLSDTIFIPAIADVLNVKDIDVYLLTNGDHSAYIEEILPDVVYYKRDSWKSDWMLSPDDILFVNILATVITTLHDYKLNKANLVRCYYICHQHGMYPKFEFYDTEYGKFFKLFLLKSNSLVNHGLLMNVHHYSNTEPKKFSCIIGPMFAHLKYIAYTHIERNRERINQIADEIRKDFFEQHKLKREESQSKQQTTQQGGNQTFFFN